MVEKYIEEVCRSLGNLNQACLKEHRKKYPAGCLGEGESFRNLRLGRSESVSRVFEVELSKALTKINEDLYFFIDHPVSLYDKNDCYMGKVYYPDIMVVKGLNLDELENYCDNKCLNKKTLRKKPKEFNSAFQTKGELVAFLELKIDLGYVDIKKGNKQNGKLFQGNFVKKMTQREEDWSNADHVKCNYIVNPADSLERKLNTQVGKIEVHNNKTAKRFAFVSSRMNHGERVQPFLDFMETINYQTCFLLERHHPNSGLISQDEIKQDIYANNKDKNSALIELLKVLTMQ